MPPYIMTLKCKNYLVVLPLVASPDFCLVTSIVWSKSKKAAIFLIQHKYTIIYIPNLLKRSLLSVKCHSVRIRTSFTSGSAICTRVMKSRKNICFITAATSIQLWLQPTSFCVVSIPTPEGSCYSQAYTEQSRRLKEFQILSKSELDRHPALQQKPRWKKKRHSSFGNATQNLLACTDYIPNTREKISN